MRIKKHIKTSAFHHIQRATLVLIIGTLLIYALGFVKSLIIAKYYGTSAELDAYVLALAPFLLISGVLSGVIHSTFIPRYLELNVKEGEDYAFSVFCTLLISVMLFVILVALVFLWQSPIIAAYLGTGFNAPRVKLTASLLQLSTALLALTSFSNIGLSLFHAHRRFVFAAFVPIVDAVCSLWYIIHFHAYGVFALIHGLILGMVVQNCIIVYAVRQFWPNEFKLFSPFHPDIKRTFMVMAPMILGAAFGHVNPLVDQMMASTLPPGSIAALHYATKLHNILTQMFIIVVSKAILPFFARQVAENDLDGLKETFRLTIQRVLWILLPGCIMILLWGKPMVQLVFQRGAFSAESTSATAGAWMAYTLGLPMQAVGILTARIYNALQDNKTLMYVAGGSISFNIFFNWVFMKIWGHIGIALSTSVIYCMTTIVLLFLLRRKIGALGVFSLNNS